MSLDNLLRIDEEYKRKGRRKDNAGDGPVPPGRIIKSSREFVAGFVPPDYSIDGLVQRRFIYSFTGATGSGKTSILLLLAALMAQEKPLGSRRIKSGRVLYLAGENPTDVQMRWIAMGDVMGFDPNTMDVHFIPGVFNILTIEEQIRAECDKLGGLDLVIVDTSAAYFTTDNENDNKQMGDHARMLRRFTTYPGEPSVIVASHPVKNATSDNLLPRGGGAFIAEMDGNFAGIKRDNTVELHWHGKFRGPDFAPIQFVLKTVTSEKLKDSEGRLIPTVGADVLTDQGHEKLQAEARKDEDLVLEALRATPAASLKRSLRCNDGNMRTVTRTSRGCSALSRNW
jgi:energy-coupling factor transporter ATP-binding protein EcfA2